MGFSIQNSKNLTWDATLLNEQKLYIQIQYLKQKTMDGYLKHAQ